MEGVPGTEKVHFPAVRKHSIERKLTFVLQKSRVAHLRHFGPWKQFFASASMGPVVPSLHLFTSVYPFLPFFWFLAVSSSLSSPESFASHRSQSEFPFYERAKRVRCVRRTSGSCAGSSERGQEGGEVEGIQGGRREGKGGGGRG